MNEGSTLVELELLSVDKSVGGRIKEGNNLLLTLIPNATSNYLLGLESI